MSQNHSDEQVAAVRAFNRFYTRKLGVLDQQLLKSPFSLSEARVLYELAHREDLSAKEIGAELGLDAGYLSRIVQNFDENGLITREPLPADRRQYQLGLTAKGRQAFAKLERSTQDDVAAMLATLPRGGGERWSARWPTIERLLGEPGAAPPHAILRDHRPGDMGWVVQSHGALYAGEYGFDASFEALVAEIAAKFLDLVRRLARALLDRRDRRRPGRLGLSGQAQRRRRQAAPAAGRSGRARTAAWASGWSPNASPSREPAGYRKITLWTQSILVAARRIYQDAGFKLVATEPHRSFGQSLDRRDLGTRAVKPGVAIPRGASRRTCSISTSREQRCARILRKCRAIEAWLRCRMGRAIAKPIASPADNARTPRLQLRPTRPWPSGGADARRAAA